MCVDCKTSWQSTLGITYKATKLVQTIIMAPSSNCKSIQCCSKVTNTIKEELIVVAEEMLRYIRSSGLHIASLIYNLSFDIDLLGN